MASPARRLLDLIKLMDNAPLNFEHNWSPYYRLLLSPDPRPHGYMLPSTVSLMPWPSSFTICHTTQTVTLSSPPVPTSLTAHANAAFQHAVDAAIDQDLFPILHRSHSEPFKILGAREPVQIERFAASLFGIATRGAHLTGYTRDAAGHLSGIWVARRSRHLFTFPGHLDSTVAGGVRADDTPLACILAESSEEASLPASYVAANVRSVGTVTLANQCTKSGLFHSDVLYVYDLDMGDLRPTPGDDEVEEFVLMGVAEVQESMLRGEFKPNVCPVIIDFLVRHGVVTPEGEEDYVEICERLRRKIPVPTSPGMGV